LAFWLLGFVLPGNTTRKEEEGCVVKMMRRIKIGGCMPEIVGKYTQFVLITPEVWKILVCL
jgi:hypothetical protein